MRALLDSSVLVAAYISRAGVCAGLLEDILVEYEWIISQCIVDELARKLKEKFKFTDSDIDEIRSFIVSSAEFVQPVDVPAGCCRDPNDLPVLGTAVAGRAKLLITVDKDLLDMKTFEGISILKPGEFWKQLEKQ